jgi:predicted CXXCH cytochrome family protein
MRRHNISFWGLMFSGLLLILTWQAVGFVQDNEPDRSGMNYIFTDMKRTPPEFDHDIHEAAFDDGGCAKCHHVLDENTKKIVYAEGEEASCTECHTAKAPKEKIALREVYHQGCTRCHRTMGKNKEKSGPTTCGECHKK